MIMLHAGFLDDRLYFWGEAAEAEQTGQTPKKAKTSRTPSRPSLPYDAGRTRLLAAFQEAGLTLKPRQLAAEALMAWLPTHRNQPLPSSPLIASSPDTSSTPPTLKPWQVSVVRLTKAQEAEFLGLCLDKEILAPGVIPGRDLRFWTMVLRWAGALVARQHFLPSLQKGAGGFLACWQPVLSGAELQVKNRLAAAMPPVCRALSREAASPPDFSSQGVLTAYVAEIVDHLVRVSPGVSSNPWSSSALLRLRVRNNQFFDSIHDQWLHALMSPDGVMAGDAAALAQFAVHLQDWQRPLTVTARAPFRLCFRLEDPEDQSETLDQPTPSEDAWYVRYLLQAVDDPSLLAPVEEAWQPQGSTARLLGARDFPVQEYLLASLGQCARLFPAIEASLRDSRPGGFRLESSGACQFLTDTAGLLEEAGFGVMLPA